MVKWKQNVLLFALICLLTTCMDGKELHKRVAIFHLIDNALWGNVDGSAVQGNFSCESIVCEMHSSDTTVDLFQNLKGKYENRIKNLNSDTITVSMYNIHTWGTLTKWPHFPDECLLPTTLTIAESEESTARFSKLFLASFGYFHGNSTTSPFSSVQRTYFSGLQQSDFLPPKPFSTLIKGASFVASTCHKGDSTTKRIAVMHQIQNSFRVDSLGKCQHTRHIPEGISLGVGATAQESLRMKQQAISHYQFYLAFENSHERGYVTEKVFDALVAGVVPVYLGSSIDCRPLLPHPNAAIFIDDFHDDIDAVTAYLQYLSANETAYEEHRSGWRANFNPLHQSPLLQQSWPCRICEWAVRTAADRVTSNSRETKKKIPCPTYK